MCRFASNNTFEFGPEDSILNISTSTSTSTAYIPTLPPTLADAPPRTPGWESLPPHGEVVQGVESLTTSFVQLGFVPRQLFSSVLRERPETVSLFLVFSILAVSAPFTPSLVARYDGSGSRATQAFLRGASAFVPQHMLESSLERQCRRFFLSSIAEWGNGDKNRSLAYMGIARLAGILHLHLHLHREEAYRLPEGSSAEAVARPEGARRTFWMLETFENLHSGADSPIAFSYADMAVLLPCDEREAALRLARASRASTPATTRGWRACWPASSATCRRSTPWSVWNLRAFKLEGQDLAFLSAVMILRLSNAILRRSYLDGLLDAAARSRTVSDDKAWQPVADQLYANMLVLHEQISVFFAHRAPAHGYPALVVFCAYVCGSLANRLHCQPQLCVAVAPQALPVLRSSVRGLASLHVAWPFAQRWHRALAKATKDIGLGLDNDGEGMPFAGGGAVGVGVGVIFVVGAAKTCELQFNDPLPLDSMLGAFDINAWDAVEGLDGPWSVPTSP
ncbi:hypothetical protein B0T24DRAFT_676755 [Lasiosphaeria ovina]|uniref:Transcription factor domain-containing protein n=1 Tax=Lasiosphaeria ovina TaxID=92902 RepID=A0AAE0NAA0_9PEZI|nr:hypothetical protein B0T24DRAFT_676755 [Lasiosphaeria ovina]